VYAVPCNERRGTISTSMGLTAHVTLTTGPMRSSSEGFVGRSELGAVCAGIGREAATTAGGREAAAGGEGAAKTVGFGASQAPAGTREAAAALPTAVVRMVGPDEDGAETVPAEGRGAEGMAGLGGMGAAPLRKEAMSTFPTGV
jgi:hypothetical protein